ncbi:M56 family metallopeptidase [Parapedobacter pyrenivorans]|uniref:M56 family metallopeptidase n=1 Tax=Parapedobacter pyrenivorans TaxID=1305674 RepID=UPI00333FD259
MENFGLLIFKGLGWGIIHSLWMGAILYGSLLLAFQFLNGRAKIKSLLAVVALLVLSGFFFLTSLYYIAGDVKSDLAAFTDGAVAFFPLSDYNSSFSFKATVEQYFPLVAVFYALGVLFQLALVVSGFRKLRMIRTQGLLEVPESWKALLASKKQQLGLRKSIAFHLSTLVDVPAVIGHFKPVILFPLALFSGISPEQVETVLIHELAHIKRRDYLFNLVKIIAETLLFFNPFVWLIGRMLETERENACDDMVVELTSSPIRYAQTLLWLEERRQLPSYRLAMQAITKKKQLLLRIQRMTNMKINYLNAKHKLAILTLLLGCIASLAWVKPFARDMEPTEMYVLPAVAVDTVAALAVDAEKNIVFQAVANDTLPPGRKSNITFTASSSATQAFEPYEDLPDSLKIEVDAARHRADSIKAYFSSPEWKEEQRKITAEVRKQTDSIKAYFTSPEWKEEQRKITVEVRKQADSLKAYFDSPEWKEKMEKIKWSDEELRKLIEPVRRQADSIRIHFESAERLP